MPRRLSSSVLAIGLALAGCSSNISLGIPADAGAADAAPSDATLLDAGERVIRLTGVPLASTEQAVDVPAPAGSWIEVDRPNVPDIAFDGTTHLVVWRAGGATSAGVGYGIRAMRLDASMRPIDPVGFLVAEGVDQYARPQVAASADGVFLVVWHVADAFYGNEVRAARVRASDGLLLYPASADGVPVWQLPGDDSFPEVASDGRDFFVTWGADHVRACRVPAASGRPSDTDCLSFDDSPNRSDVACAGTRCLVGWGGGRLVHARELTVGTTRLEASAPLIFDPAYPVGTYGVTWPQLAATSDTFLFTWVAREADTPVVGLHVRGLRVAAADLRQLDATPLDLLTSGAPPAAIGVPNLEPRVAARGNEFVVLGFAEVQLRTEPTVTTRWARTGSDGLRIDAAPHEVLGGMGAVCGSGAHFAIVHRPRSARHIEAFLTGDDGTAGAPTRTGVTAGVQHDPAVAFDGTNYLVVWIDEREAGGVYGVRVRASDGELLDVPAKRLIPMDARTAATDRSVAVASEGSSFLVVTSVPGVGGLNQVFGLGVDSGTGELLGAPFQISSAITAATVPRVASNGTNYLVVWEDMRRLLTDGGSIGDVYAARVKADGTVLDPENFPLAMGARGSRAPSVAALDGGYVTIWQRCIGDCSLIESVRVSAEGVVSASQILSAGGTAEYGSTVGAHRGRGLAVWRDSRDMGTTGLDLYGVALGAEGTTDGVEHALVHGAASEANPAVAADGRSSLLMWQDERGLMGARFDVSLERIDDSEFVIAAETSDSDFRMSSAAAAAGPALFLAAYVRHDERLAAEQVRMRFLVFNDEVVLE